MVDQSTHAGQLRGYIRIPARDNPYENSITISCIRVVHECRSVYCFATQELVLMCSDIPDAWRRSVL